MKRFNTRRQLPVIPAFVAAALAMFAARAQSAAPPKTNESTNGEGLQEVVVTAQFRSENVQQTPLAITAVDAEAIAARGQTSVTEIAQDAPSVQLNQEAGAFGPSMR